MTQVSVNEEEKVDQRYWQDHYVLTTDAETIAINLTRVPFVSRGQTHELICFIEGEDAPSILVSPGSGGHAYVFAELGYLMRLRGYNVFIMPKHGGYPIDELCRRHGDALRAIERRCNDRIGVFSEGLGGLAVFYLSLAHGPLKSAVYQNAPALLTERKYHEAIVKGGGAGLRRRLAIPVISSLSRVLPHLKIPIALYLNFEELIDPKPENQRIEASLVKGFLEDPDFDRSYPISAIMSLISTPPPAALADLTTPTMFLVPRRGLIPDYFEDLFGRLPPIKKKLVEGDGSVFWMLSHPKEAAKIICDWFDETIV